MDISGNSLQVSVTSPLTKDYNCIAWAAEDNSQWWWPDEMLIGYWPAEVPREETVGAFVAAYKLLGYQVCNNSEAEEGFIKIALYVDAKGKPTHASRQLNNGNWTSKLGCSFDVEHDFIKNWPDVIAGVISHKTSGYGSVAIILKKPISGGA